MFAPHTHNSVLKDQLELGANT